MNLVVTTEQRFECTPDGVIWTESAHAYSFWERYLAVFDQVRVVARVRKVPSVPLGWNRADGERVSFVVVPYYVGPQQYLLHAWQVMYSVRKAVDPNNAIILRAPSPIAGYVTTMLSRANHPYGIEVLCDPYDVFSPGSDAHLLRPFYRWWFVHQLNRYCARACAVAYVTQGTLQRRYPPAPGVFSTHYSSVELPDEAFVSNPRPLYQGQSPLTLIFIGWLDQPYKRLDVLIDAMHLCLQKGLDIRLTVIGDGKYCPRLAEQAAKLGLLDNRISFVGSLPAGDAVRAQLDVADLFVLPSGTEGLPRAMIEAMARALPCIGSAVGGIPELLPPEDMVLPGDPNALAAKICEVLSSSERMARMSARNLKKAKEYHNDVLHERRTAFYRHVRERTETWLRISGR